LGPRRLTGRIRPIELTLSKHQRGTLPGLGNIGMFSDQLRCCVPGCAHSAARVTVPGCVEIMCEAHYALASPAAQARRARREDRLRTLQRIWNDDAYFDRLVASGKYLKLCSVLSFATENAERAWGDIKDEVLSAAKAPDVTEKVGAAA
jgi:hypothetical protein